MFAETTISRRVLLFVLITAAFSLGGCGPYLSHRFQTDPTRVAAAKVIALTPVNVPSVFLESEQKKHFFQHAITTKLRQAGYGVVTPEVYADMMSELIREKGDIYDSITGKQDKKKYEELLKACMSAVERATGAKAFLWAKVAHVSVPFAGCNASWDGVTEHVSDTFLGVFCSTSNRSGRTRALSLLLHVVDADGNILYFNGGGIQLLDRYIGGLPFAMVFKEVGKEHLLADNTLNQTAVDIALAPLLNEQHK